MMDQVQGLIFALTLAALAPVVARLTAAWSNRVAKIRALRRVQGEPTYFVGAKVKELHVEGKEQPLITDAEIVSMSLGRIELATKDRVLPLTNLEFEAAHAVMDTSK